MARFLSTNDTLSPQDITTNQLACFKIWETDGENRDIHSTTVGTTVAPWQLFFQQSNVIDKRLTPRWIKHERTDTIVGSFITNITAGGLMVATAFAFAHTSFAGQFVDAGTTAHALVHSAGRVAPLAELPRPTWSTARKVGMMSLRGYLVVAVVLLAIKIVQLV